MAVCHVTCGYRKYKSSFTDGVAGLDVNNVTLQDAGWYRCEATNKAGRVETHCTLLVNSK